MSRIHDALKLAEKQRLADLGPKRDLVPEQSASPEFWAGLRSPEKQPASVPSSSVPPLKDVPELETKDASDRLLQRCVKAQWSPSKDALFLNASESTLAGLEEFRSLRAKLFQVRSKQPLKTLLISSSVPSEGKSFVSANLAQAFARQRGGRTLLIDADIRKPHLHEVLGAPSSPGLFEYLSDKATEEEIIQKWNSDDLFFIPGGKVSSNAAELIGNGRMKTLIEKMSPLFSWIVIDSSPVIPVSDPTRLAENCDGVLIVVRAGSTSHLVAERAVKEFHHSNILGVVLNQVTRKENPYYKYSYSNYGQ